MIGTIHHVLVFSYRFFTVVVINCATPENFSGCVRVDQWLLPDIQNYAPYLWGDKKPYDSEKEILNTINN